MPVYIVGVSDDAAEEAYSRVESEMRDERREVEIVR
jgi:hypothetical protein